MLVHLHHWHPEIPAAAYAAKVDGSLGRFHGVLHDRHEDRTIRLKVRHDRLDVSTRRPPPDHLTTPSDGRGVTADSDVATRQKGVSV